MSLKILAPLKTFSAKSNKQDGAIPDASRKHAFSKAEMALIW